MGETQRRVLVVDDDHECRLMLSTLMAQRGFVIDSVADGNMAMLMLQNQPPGLVLLDAHLPGLDGWEVCRSIKGSDATKHIPVIMLTAFVSPEARQKSLDAGADEFVPKPFRADSLVEMIENLLKISDAAHQLDPGESAMVEGLKEP